MSNAVSLPRHNPHLLGHLAAEQQFRANWLGDRLHHAWLLQGAPGIGKATMAFRMARFLLAGGNSDADMFGGADNLFIPPEHPVFRRLAALGHADFLLIERAFDEKKGRLSRDIKIDDVRKIAPFLRMTAAEGGWRVVVIDGADGINRAGQNALLKILEEPPAGAILILTADQPGALLPTVRSRCRRLELSPPGWPDALSILRGLHPDLAEEKLQQHWHLADCSIGLAHQALQEGGVEIIQDLFPLLFKPPLPRLQLSQQLDALTTGASHRLDFIGDLWLQYLAQQLRQQARSNGAAVAKKLDLWEKSRAAWQAADRGNLDRRQALLNIFYNMDDWPS